jgi:peptide/nickel transport system permease protein
VRRTIAVIAILFVVSFFSFMLIRLLPGDPVSNILGGYPRSADPAVYDHVYKAMGFDKSLIQQYFMWLNDLLHGNLKSYASDYTNPQPIMPTIRSSLIIDFELILISQIIALGLALPLALRSARRPNQLFDRSVSGSTFVLLAVPAFVLITILTQFFAVKLQIPGIGVSSWTAFSTDWIANLKSAILPSVVLAIGSFVVYFRVFRTDLITTYQEEFITMARSKGLSRRRITWRHAVRPSIVPLLGTIGISIPALIAGTFIVEFKLAIPGLGYQLVSAVQSKDYAMLQAIILIVASITVIFNFLIDLSFGFVDPRISRE